MRTRSLRKMTPQVWLLSSAAGLLALVLDVPPEDAYGESKKKKKTKVRHQHEHAVEDDGEEHDHAHSHEHSHDHDHGHHHHSKLIMTAAATVAASLGGSKEEDDEEEGHSHDLRSAMLHDHGGGSGDEPSEDGTIEPTFSLGLGYRVKEPFSLISSISFRPSSGLNDPAVGVGYESEAARNVEIEGSLTATIPLSKESKEHYKTTTIALTAGPHLTKGKWSYGLEGGVAMSFYSKTVVEEEEEEGEEKTTSPFRLKPLTLQEDHDHDHEDEHDHVEGGHHDDREFNRYSVEPSLGYKLAKKIRVGAGLELAMATHQFGPSAYEIVATLAQATYSAGPFAVTGTLATIGEGESLTAPTEPFVAFGLLYINE